MTSSNDRPALRPHLLGCLCAVSIFIFGMTAIGSSLRDLNKELTTIRETHGVPALAAAEVNSAGQVLSLGVTGLRVASSDHHVESTDLFHIGSCTKSMTATLAALLVQEELLHWDSTLGDVLGERVQLPPDEYAVTLTQLLTHRSGLPEDRTPNPDVWGKIRAMQGPLPEQRLRLVELAFNQPDLAPPGERYAYSNSGYVAAAAMLETVTGQSWEQLMRARLFAPLQMHSADFGSPGSALNTPQGDQPDQPWGHVLRNDQPTPVPPGVLADNPAVTRPAGGVHCSIEDFARYAAAHLQWARTAQGLDEDEAHHDDSLKLTPASLARLYTPPEGQPYALGWNVAERPWARGVTCFHAGSNTMWFAVIWLAPGIDRAYVVATNDGSPAGFHACDAAIVRSSAEAQATDVDR